MSERLESLGNKVDALAESVSVLSARIDGLAERVETLSSSVDARFTEVSEQFVEQRKYTELAYTDLVRRMNQMEHKLETGMAAQSALMTSRFERLERKLDQFIDAQLRINQTVERQLRSLKGRRARPS